MACHIYTSKYYIFLVMFYMSQQSLKNFCASQKMLHSEKLYLDNQKDVRGKMMPQHLDDSQLMPQGQRKPTIPNHIQLHLSNIRSILECIVNESSTIYCIILKQKSFRVILKINLKPITFYQLTELIVIWIRRMIINKFYDIPFYQLIHGMSLGSKFQLRHPW